MKHIAKFAPIVTSSCKINELEKIFNGPEKLPGVSRKGPLDKQVEKFIPSCYPCQLVGPGQNRNRLYQHHCLKFPGAKSLLIYLKFLIRDTCLM